MELRLKYQASGIELDELEVALEEALAAEPEAMREGVAIRVEEAEDGFDGVTAFIVLWVADKVAGNAVNRALNALWERVLDRLRARKGHHVLKPADDEATSRDSPG